MAEEQVGLKVTATDATAAAFNAIKGGLRGLTNAVEGLKNKFGNLGNLLAAGAAFKGFQSFIQGANEGIGAANRFEASFKGITDEANKMAENLQNNYAMTDDEAQNLLTTFNSMLKSMGLSQQAAAGLSSTMAQLAVDMSNFAQVPVDQAVSDLSMALNGQTKGLREYGIVIDDTKIQLTALEEGLGNAKGELSQVEKAFVMQKLIMKEAGDIVGYTAKHFDSFQVQSKKFKASLDAASDSIGNFLLPQLTDLMKMFQDLPGVVSVLVVAFPPLIAMLAALGGPLTAVVAGFTGIVWAISKIYSHLDAAKKSTMEYVNGLKDIAKINESMTIVQQKYNDQLLKTAELQEKAKDTRDINAASALKASIDEEMRLLSVMNVLQDKITAHEKEQKAIAEVNANRLKDEAQAAQKKQALIDAEKAAREQAIKDEEQAWKDFMDWEASVAEFTKEIKISSLVDEFEQRRQRLEQWHTESLDLIRGNKEAEVALEKQYSNMKNQIVADEFYYYKDAKEKQAELELQYTQNFIDTAKTLTGTLSQNLAIIGSEIKEFFFLSKAAAIADATMAGIQSVVNSFNFGTKIGGPIVGGIMAGIAAVATGIQVAKIAATPPPFQTAFEQQRTVMGPSTRPQLATLHGGENVSRKGSGSIIINVAGSIYNSEETLDQIANGIRYYTKQTGFALA